MNKIKNQVIQNFLYDTKIKDKGFFIGYGMQDELRPF